MPRINLIAAATPEGVIAADGKIPWSIPDDMRYFRNTTLRSTVVMGRKTWDSLPAQYRPLPHRVNIVMSRDPAFVSAEGVTVARTLNEAVALCRTGDLWVIGGAELYWQFMPLATRIYLTVVRPSAQGFKAFPPDAKLTVFPHITLGRFYESEFIPSESDPKSVFFATYASRW
jgi:dihydrofolate reductase